jgi:hypothetical protein
MHLAAADKGFLPIVTLHACPATQLVALFFSRLHPSTQAQAPVTEPEGSVPGQPNICEAAGVEMGGRRWGLRVFFALEDTTLYIFRALGRPPPKSLLNQHFSTDQLDLATFSASSRQDFPTVRFWTGLHSTALETRSSPPARLPH